MTVGTPNYILNPIEGSTPRFADTHQLDGLLGCLFSAEGDESIAPVQAAQRLHHQSEVPDGAGLLKKWYQFVLEQVTRDFAYKDLKSQTPQTFFKPKFSFMKDQKVFAILRSGRLQQHTSVPTVGWAPVYTDSGGGPPYFR